MKKSTNIGAMIAAITLGAIISMGCHSTGDRYERSTGQYIDDKALASAVEDALENHPIYKLDEVVVNAYRGTVQLSGFVSSQEQKDEAGEVASQATGALNVENNISIRPGPLQQPEGDATDRQQPSSADQSESTEP
jgi:osmotically-inducible protein OsmY